MNITIYIENSIGYKINEAVKSTGKTRNAIFREAIEEWYKNHMNKQWEPGFFDFKPITDCPDFTQYRHELKKPNEDPLQ